MKTFATLIPGNTRIVRKVSLLLAALLTISTVRAVTIINVQSSADGAANAANCPGAGCRLRDALAQAVDGDVIQFSVTGAITLTNGELQVQSSISIVGNPSSAVDGGAASRVFHIAAGKTVTISGLTIRNGSAGAGAVGGGIYNDHAILTVTDSTVSGNSASGGGGGIFNDGRSAGSAMLTVSNSTFNGNSTGSNGGGIYNGAAGGSATLTVSNSTFSSNSAGSGGGIDNDGTAGGSAMLTVNNSTFNSNSFTNIAIFGGGGSAPVTIGNTILNGGGFSPNIDNNAGTVTSNGYNLSSDGGGGFLVAATDQINTDPMLAPLGDNGGPTFTHALLIGSPAIDKGKDLSGTGKDQRGRNRPNDDPLLTNATGGDGSDIGAFELYTVKVTNNKDDNSTETLRKALADALPGDGIYFDPTLTGQTIKLTSGELLVSKSVDISGLGPTIVAVDGNATSRVFHIGPGKTVTISGLTIRNGLASGSFPDNQGGGIYNDHATLTVTSSTVTINHGTLGGGICNDGSVSGSATLTISNSTLSGNSGGGGGGIYNFGGLGSATVTLTNSTFSGNSASVGGGGILNEGDAASGPSDVTITSSTFSGNSAPNGAGGAIQNLGSNATLMVGNTILKAGASGVNILNDSGAVTSNGYNLSSDGGVTNTNGGTGSLNATGDHINTDPMLAPLGDNGGATFTHALLIGSPAIDKGKDLSGTGKDQRGRTRPNDDPSITNATGGDGSDIGAFELYTIKVTNNKDDNSAETLREALVDALPGDGIYFDATLNGQAITLTGGELLVDKSVDISGPGAANLAVDGNANSRVFFINQGSTVTISGLTVRNGLAGAGSFGGGIYNFKANLILTNSIITGNSANFGGGIYNNGPAALTLINSTVSSNFAPNGGGIYNNGQGLGNAAMLTLTNSTISGNSANLGGGIYNNAFTSGSNASVTLANSTLSGNSVTTGGGCIYNDGHTGGNAPLTITNCTFSGNSAQNGAGGAIHSFGASGSAPVTIGNTILKAGASGANILNDSGTVTSSGYNLSSDGGVTNINGGAGALNATADHINIDPKLAPLGDNGGGTMTHALLIGSPAIDKGKDLSGTGKDQRGRNRPNDDPLLTNATGGDGSDIGAFELYTVKVTNNKDDNSTETLRKALADALPGDGIYFDPTLTGQTIKLTSGELLVSKSVDISGLGPTIVAVDGNATSRVFHIGPGKTVTISGLTIRNGLASGSFPDNQGGGIYNDHATLTVTSSTVTINHGTLGGGICNDGSVSGSATLTISNSTLSGNSGGGGGGIYNFGGLGSATVTLTNSTFSGNSASVGGGGILNEGDAASGPSDVTITSSTFSGNSAPNGAGGAIQNLGSNATLMVGNTILKAGASGVNILNDSGAVTSNGYNLSSDGGVTNTNGGTGSLNATGDHINTDPMLAPLANNGGSTMTHALLSGSPALDAGSNTLASNAGLLTDGRGVGFSRVLDAASDADTTQTVDIGAFEANPSIEDISDKSTAEDTPLSFTFRVGDSATAFGSITATSSNTTLVPNANVVVGNDTPSTRKLTITPAANKNGTTTITVTVTKTISGTPVSMSDTFVLTVTPVNDPPVANSQSVTTNEDTQKSITLTGSDVDADPLTFSVVTGPAHGTLTGAAPNLTYKPTANYNGMDSFTFKANDGHISSNTATVSITVNPVNDAPSFTKGPNQTITAGTGPHTVNPWATNISAGPANESGQSLTFILSNNNNSLFTSQPAVSSNGTLSYTPKSTAGSATVTVTLKDSGGTANGGHDTSASQTFAITIVAPTPTPTPTATATIAPTPTATATPTPTPKTAQSLNIATRLDAGTGDKLMIAGFIVTGNASKPVLLRGIGPSLAAFGIEGVLLDPVLELRTANSSLMINDNWVDSPQRSQFEGTVFQPSDDRESVVLGTLVPGNYTALLTGNNNTGGVGVVEAYDRDQTVDARLANISTRGFVEAGNNVMIGGFILGGSPNSTRIAVRGIGPSLAQFGLNPVLQDPTLELRDMNGTVLVANDDWLSDPLSASMLTANGLALHDPKESGIFTTLPPGQFTAILAGKDGGIGIALVEIYNLQ